MESKRIILWQYVVFGLFIGISLLAAGYHEHWADEVQAWLIAKEAGWSEIIAYIPHHEGQPVLWIALLKLLLYCFNTPDVLFLSTVIMAVTVWIILFRYDIPPVYKILIPFGQYFIYQYNVIARNYCLGYLALALTGLLYKDRHSHRFAYAASLLLLAESTTFYAPVAVVLGVAWFCEGWQIMCGKIKPYLLPMSMLAFFGFVLVWQMLPLPEMSFSDMTSVSIYSRYLYTQNYLLYILKHLFYSLLNFPLIIAFYIMLCVYLMRNGVVAAASHTWRGIKALRIGFVCFLAFMVVFYLAIPLSYHQGLVWGLFLFVCYISVSGQKPVRANAFFVLLMALQVIRGAAAIFWDINIPVSAQTQTADIIREHTLPDTKIMPVTYSSLPLKLLFEREKLALPPENPLYFRWDKDIVTGKQVSDDLYSVLVIGADLLSAYRRYIRNNKSYYLYITPAYLPFPQTGTFLNHTHYIFIPKAQYITPKS